jgi:uncharacterized protein
MQMNIPWQLALVPALAAWVGHACFWTLALNHLYGRRLSKRFLKPFRLFVGAAIATFPAWLWLGHAHAWPFLYFVACVVMGTFIFPLVTLVRLLRRPPAVVRECVTHTRDLWPEHRQALVGDGRMRWAVRLPGTCAFRVDFTTLRLELPGRPVAWQGLRILLLSDFHFHGTPSELYFQLIVDELLAGPTPDVVVLAGDYLDSHTHHDWIERIIGQLRWTECGIAILGNHDAPYNPYRTREILARAGFNVVSDCFVVLSIRGVPTVVVGHEGPWFRRVPDLSTAPPNYFRLGISHTPDQFYWAQAQKIQLLLCGHVHGGQIRLPVIGSIFIPSIYSRRFDEGVFHQNDTVMVVNRGLSGKEPLRFRCHPQVMLVELL